MQLRFSFRHICLFCCLFLLPLLVGCDLLPTITINTATMTPTATLNTWATASQGVEMRKESWQTSSGSKDTVNIVRFDLRYVKLEVDYQPDQPLSMEQWMDKEQAIALINGGYFNGNDQATGLVIANSQVAGTSYQGFGGMLDVNAQGKIELRSLSEQPYDSSEGLTQATQCSPMLMWNSQRTQFKADTNVSPRSVVAIDKQGHLLFIVSSSLAFTLDDMADLLVKSDLNLVSALNLDGGSSTGLYVNAGSQHITIDSYVNLPIIIAVKAK